MEATRWDDIWNFEASLIQSLITQQVPKKLKSIVRILSLAPWYENTNRVFKVIGIYGRVMKTGWIMNEVNFNWLGADTRGYVSWDSMLAPFFEGRSSFWYEVTIV